MSDLRVNLLPADYRPPKPLGTRAYMMAAFVFLLAFGSTLYYTGVARQRDQLLAAASSLESEHDRLQQALQRAARIKEQEEKAARVEASLTGLKGRTWWPALLAFKDLTPAGVSWAVVEAEGNKLRIRGSAATLNDWAEFVTGLITASNYVEGVDPHQARENPKTGRYDVELTVRLQAEEG